MPGETEGSPSGWTVDTSRADMLGLLAERDRRYAEQRQADRDQLATIVSALKESSHVATQAAREAMTKAETAQDRRLDSMNEFRETLTAQAATFLTKDEANARFSAFGDRLGQATTTLTDKIEGSTALLSAAIADLSNRVNTAGGRSAGIVAAWGYIVSAVVLTGAVISIVIALTR